MLDCKSSYLRMTILSSVKLVAYTIKQLPSPIIFTGFRPIRASLVVNTDILEIFTGPGFNSISSHTNKKRFSDVFILCILHLFVFRIFIGLSNVHTLCWFLLLLRTFAIFRNSFFNFSIFLARHAFLHCHMYILIFASFWLKHLRYTEEKKNYLVESKLCKADDLGINRPIKLFILCLLVLFLLME